MAMPRPRKGVGVRRELISRSARPRMPGNDERGEEQRPHDGFGDEDEAAGVPARVEGKERTHAVVVGPVEQDVAER